jgi:hypothetical protein
LPSRLSRFVLLHNNVAHSTNKCFILQEFLRNKFSNLVICTKIEINDDQDKIQLR